MESCRIIRVAEDEPTQMSRRLRRCIAPQFQTARSLTRRAAADPLRHSTRRHLYGRFEVFNGHPHIESAGESLPRYSQFQENRLNRVKRNFGGRPRPWRGASIGVASLLASVRRQPLSFRNPSRRHLGNTDLLDQGLIDRPEVQVSDYFGKVHLSVNLVHASGIPHDRWIPLRKQSDPYPRNQTVLERQINSPAGSAGPPMSRALTGATVSS
jgi:hypothetical protein